MGFRSCEAWVSSESSAGFEKRDQSWEPSTPGVPSIVVYQAIASLPYGVAS